MELDDWEWEPDAMWKIETGLRAYLDQLMGAIFDYESDYFLATESGLPFCGCTTCTTREIMAFLVPRVGELHEKGQLWRHDSA